MKLTDFKVLTFDVVGTLINFEQGVLASVRRLGGAAAKDLTDDQIFEPYMRGRAKYPGRSSHEMANVYLSLARELGLPDDAQSAAAFQRD
ncbi:HAD family hydrolase, partial [Mesorhizobium sp. M3A.F.Ca.ET.174.01.1.1]